jgi:hypothetical protein
MGVPILEHRLYGASIGFCLMLSVACSRYSAGIAASGQGKKWNLGYGIAVFIVILYSLLTVERNRIWQNDVSVWSDTVKKSPNSVTALNNLGSAQIREKNMHRRWPPMKKSLPSIRVLQRPAIISA